MMNIGKSRGKSYDVVIPSWWDQPLVSDICEIFSVIVEEGFITAWHGFKKVAQGSLLA